MQIPQQVSSPVDYGRLIQTLDSCDQPLVMPCQLMTYELLRLWDCAQRFLRDEDGDNRYELMRWNNSQQATLEQPQTISEIIKESREYQADLSKIFQADYPNATAQLESIWNKIDFRKGKTLLGSMALDYKTMFKRRCRYDAHRNACRIVFYLHDYKTEHGHWPENLTQALPKDVAQNLKDPFSGRSFCYRLDNDEPVLYSVGINGTDDGGQPFMDDDGNPAWGETGDYVFWPREE